MSAILSQFMASARSMRAKNGAIAFLTYHRVGEFSFDPQHLAITTQEFATHLEFFKSRYTLLTAGDAFNRIRTGASIPRNGLVLTFDDGYAEMATTILEALQYFEAPATYFIATDTSHPFWWDELALLSENPPDLLNWNVEQNVKNERQRSYLERAQRLESLTPTDRRSYLNELRAQFHNGQDATIAEQTRRLTPEEIVKIDATGLIEVGAHTTSHARLSVCTHEEQQVEIESSKDYLEELLGHKVTSFSYPYGTKGSYTQATRLFAKKAGFLGACTTMLTTDVSRLPWGALYAGESEDTLFMTPRIATVNKSPKELLAAIDKALAL